MNPHEFTLDAPVFKLQRVAGATIGRKPKISLFTPVKERVDFRPQRAAASRQDTKSVIIDAAPVISSRIPPLIGTPGILRLYVIHPIILRFERISRLIVIRCLANPLQQHLIIDLRRQAPARRARSVFCKSICIQHAINLAYRIRTRIAYRLGITCKKGQVFSHPGLRSYLHSCILTTIALIHEHSLFNTGGIHKSRDIQGIDLIIQGFHLIFNGILHTAHRIAIPFQSIPSNILVAIKGMQGNKSFVRRIFSRSPEIAIEAGIAKFSIRIETSRQYGISRCIVAISIATPPLG